MDDEKVKRRKIPIILSQDERDEDEEEYYRILALNTILEAPSISQQSSPPSSQQIYSSSLSSSESQSTPLSQSLIPNKRKLSQEESIQNVNNVNYDETKSIDFGDTSEDDDKNDDNRNINVQIPNANSLIRTKRSVD
jgi:hypothetical protein